MLELAEKDIKMVIIIVFHMFKKLKERLNMLSVTMEDSNQTYRDGTDNVIDWVKDSFWTLQKKD